MKYTPTSHGYTSESRANDLLVFEKCKKDL